MSTDHAQGFPPLEAATARVLILGSMPGVASLEAAEYYAHPRNAFWPVMAELLSFDLEAPYSERVQAITAAGVLVWDVLAECERPGSLDAKIRNESVQVNDFAGLFARQPDISHVFFNGAKAEELFRRHVPAELTERHVLTRLPSTSPAMASLNLEAKLAAWRAVGEALALHRAE